MATKNSTTCELSDCPQLKVAKIIVNRKYKQIKVSYYQKHWNNEKIINFLFANKLNPDEDEIKSVTQRQSGKGNFAFAWVNTSCFEKLLKMEQVKIGKEVCTIEENIHPSRCPFCYSYEHEYCESDTILCARCGQSHRESETDCRRPYRCVNCSREMWSVRYDHATKEDAVCPIFKKYKNHLIQHLKDMNYL